MTEGVFLNQQNVFQLVGEDVEVDDSGKKKTQIKFKTDEKYSFY